MSICSYDHILNTACAVTRSSHFHTMVYSKTCVNGLCKKELIGFQDQLSSKALQKAPGEGKHSAILSTFIKLPFAIKIFVLSVLEWPFYTGFTVVYILY